MRHNDENTGVLVNCCQLGNNDVVDASWRKYVARPLHFFSPPSLFFAKSHWKPGRTGISFAIIRAQFTRGNLETVFFTERSRMIISLFCILLASSIVAADRMDERNVRGRRIFVTCPMIYTRNRGFNGDLGIEFFISVKISS